MIGDSTALFSILKYVRNTCFKISVCCEWEWGEMEFWDGKPGITHFLGLFFLYRRLTQPLDIGVLGTWIITWSSARNRTLSWLYDADTSLRENVHSHRAKRFPS